MSPSRSPSPLPLLRSTPFSFFSSWDPDLVQHWFLSEDLMHNCPFNIKTCQGCDGSNPECLSEDGSDRRSDSSSSSSTTGAALSHLRPATPSSIISFNSSVATRVQLREEFLGLYFPAGISHGDTDFMFSKFLCRDMLEDKGPTSRLAIDALTFIQIGVAQSDERLIHEAQSRYHVAVRDLIAELADPMAMYNDGVLSAAYILGFCEVFQPLCPTEGIWKAHHRLRDLLVTRGPDEEYSTFAQLLLYNFRHVAANAGTAARRKVPIAGKEWKRCAAITDVFMSTLTDHIITLPEALQKAHAAMEPADPLDLYDSMVELASYERSMQAWLIRWYSSFENLPYHLEDVGKYRHLQVHTRNAPEVFQKVLRFPSFSRASAQIVYWTTILQIKQRMYGVNQRSRPPILPKPEKVLISEVNEIAEKLCQSVGWLTSPRFGLCGVLSALGALHHASGWYSKRMDIPKLVWCQNVSKSLERRTSLVNIYEQGESNSNGGEEGAMVVAECEEDEGLTEPP